MLLRGKLQKYAKNSNFENFESALYSTSGSMPLSGNYRWSPECEKVISDILSEIEFSIAISLLIMKVNIDDLSYGGAGLQSK